MRININAGFIIRKIYSQGLIDVYTKIHRSYSLPRYTVNKKLAVREKKRFKILPNFHAPWILRSSRSPFIPPRSATTSDPPVSWPQTLLGKLPDNGQNMSSSLPRQRIDKSASFKLVSAKMNKGVGPSHLSNSIVPINQYHLDLSVPRECT
jgi:hypothetical protein